MRKIIKIARGITLVELIMVMVVIAILGAVIVPKVFISLDDARSKSATAILSGLRTNIAEYSSKQLAATGTHSLPAYSDITTLDLVVQGQIPSNPFTDLNGIRDADNEYVDGAATQAVSDSSIYGWAYDQTNGKIWANSSINSENGL